jgi:hypothetical protein
MLKADGAESPEIRSLNDASRNTYELMTQTAECGLRGCRINPHPRLGTSSEIHAAGEREVRVFKRFRCRLNCLTPRDMLKCRISACFFSISALLERRWSEALLSETPKWGIGTVAN